MRHVQTRASIHKLKCVAVCCSVQLRYELTKDEARSDTCKHTHVEVCITVLQCTATHDASVFHRV